MDMTFGLEKKLMSDENPVLHILVTHLVIYANCFHVGGMEQLWASFSSSFESIVFSIVLSFLSLVGLVKKKAVVSVCFTHSKILDFLSLFKECCVTIQ